MRILVFTCFFLFASLVQIFPRLWELPIARGQLSKQTFVAEMAKSFNQGEVNGIFPKRHFLEPYHPGPVAWAEEVPLQVGATALLNKISGLEYNVAGKCIAFLFFLLLIGGALRLGGPVFALPFALFPIFRLYASLNLPEMGMLALALWAIAFAKKEKWISSAVFLALAIAWKYYAAFTALGLAIYAYKRSKKIWPSLLLLASALPAIAYLVYFLQKGIPNPIIEYREVSGTGHFGGIQKFLFSLSYYGRLVTWNLVKNPSILGTAIAFLGIFLLWKNKIREQEWRPLLLSLTLSQILFALLFAPAFYVHDYYGIQITLILAMLAGIACKHLLESDYNWQRVLASALLVALFLFSYRRFERATLPQFCYAEAAEELKVRTLPSEWGIWIMDGYGESALYMADRTAWMLSNKTWMEFNKLTTSGEARLQDSRAEWLAILLTGEDPEGRWRWIRDRIAPFGWKKVVYMKKNFTGENLVTGHDMPAGFKPLSIDLGQKKDLLSASLWILRR